MKEKIFKGFTLFITVAFILEMLPISALAVEEGGNLEDIYHNTTPCRWGVIPPGQSTPKNLFTQEIYFPVNEFSQISDGSGNENSATTNGSAISSDDWNNGKQITRVISKYVMENVTLYKLKGNINIPQGYLNQLSQCCGLSGKIDINPTTNECFTGTTKSCLADFCISASGKKYCTKFTQEVPKITSSIKEAKIYPTYYYNAEMESANATESKITRRASGSIITTQTSGNLSVCGSKNTQGQPSGYPSCGGSSDQSFCSQCPIWISACSGQTWQSCPEIIAMCSVCSQAQPQGEILPVSAKIYSFPADMPDGLINLLVNGASDMEIYNYIISTPGAYDSYIEFINFSSFVPSSLTGFSLGGGGVTVNPDNCEHDFYPCYKFIPTGSSSTQEIPQPTTVSKIPVSDLNKPIKDFTWIISDNDEECRWYGYCEKNAWVLDKSIMLYGSGSVTEFSYWNIDKNQGFTSTFSILLGTVLNMIFPATWIFGALALGDVVGTAGAILFSGVGMPSVDVPGVCEKCVNGCSGKDFLGSVTTTMPTINGSFTDPKNNDPLQIKLEITADDGSEPSGVATGFKLYRQEGSGSEILIKTKTLTKEETQIPFSFSDPRDSDRRGDIIQAPKTYTYRVEPIVNEGVGGSASKDISTLVLPNCDISASPSTVFESTNTTLKWDCDNDHYVDTCELSGGVFHEPKNEDPQGGTESVKVNEQTTYYLTCRNSSGITVPSTTVKVTPSVIHE